MDSGFGLLKKYGGVRATRTGDMPDAQKADFLVSYEQMLKTGCDLSGNKLSDGQLKTIEIQAAKWRRELASEPDEPRPDTEGR